MINSTAFNVSLDADYDRNGEIIYTIVTILFYSLSLFCTLLLNLDPDDHYYGKKWSAYLKSDHRRTRHSSQVDVLNILSNESLRKKYWRIYYGDAEYEIRSREFQFAESKRLSFVSQLVVQLQNEKLKHQELDELHRITVRGAPQTSPTPSTPSFLLKFRRSRSTSVPGVILSDAAAAAETRSVDAICQMPICPPPTIVVTKHP